MTDLGARLAAGEVVLIDGATGTELEMYEVPMDDFAWCGLASLSHPDAGFTEVDHVDVCLDVVQAHWAGPVGVYAQTGEYIQPHWIFTDTITPAEYTDACLGWVARGVQVIGGCCGIRPAHIEHLRDRLPHTIPT